MAEAVQRAEHVRSGFVGRSGDTFLIDPTQDNAEAVNLDQQAREEAEAARVEAIESDLTVPQIKAELDRLGIAYDATVRKAELAQLLADVVAGNELILAPEDEDDGA